MSTLGESKTTGTASARTWIAVRILTKIYGIFLNKCNLFLSGGILVFDTVSRKSYDYEVFDTVSRMGNDHERKQFLDANIQNL
jgi:hypothetical protein